jgi:hypothetical protein
MKIYKEFLLVFLALSLPGCATIVGGQTEAVTVHTEMAGSRILGASCTLSNNSGTWVLTTPGTAQVTRGYGPLAISCSMEQLPTGTMVLNSSTKALAFGNLIYGGLAGVVTDGITASAYDYPEKVTVHMGEDGSASYKHHFLPDGFFNMSEY